MPNRWPITSGNWSNAAIWSGSLIPTASDDVFLNNQTVTLDQDITVVSIRNAASASAIVAGGRIEIYSDYNITATPNGFQPYSNSVTNGFIQYFNTGSIILTGNISLNVSGLLGSIRGIGNINTGTINFIGDMFGFNSSNTSWCLGNLSSGTINMIGNVTAGQNATAFGVLNNLNGIVNITGDINGGPTSFNRSAIQNTSTGIVNITGNVIAGTNSTNITSGINNVSIGTVNVTGNVTGLGTAGITSAAAGIINVIGQLQASTTANAVSSTSTTATNIFSGPLINSGSRNAIYCYNVRLYDDVTTRYTIGVSGSNDTITLYSPDQVTGVPSGSDVRAGVIYGPGNELTGSMNVPHPNSVSYGVTVDNTTGSALVKPEDIWNIALTSLSSSNSIGQRLSSTITSASMAAIVNSFS
jgi:hypothetical protein